MSSTADAALARSSHEAKSRRHGGKASGHGWPNANSRSPWQGNENSAQQDSLVPEPGLPLQWPNNSLLRLKRLHNLQELVVDVGLVRKLRLDLHGRSKRRRGDRKQYRRLDANTRQQNAPDHKTDGGREPPSPNRSNFSGSEQLPHRGMAADLVDSSVRRQADTTHPVQVSECIFHAQLLAHLRLSCHARGWASHPDRVIERSSLFRHRQNQKGTGRCKTEPFAQCLHWGAKRRQIRALQPYSCRRLILKPSTRGRG